MTVDGYVNLFDTSNQLYDLAKQHSEGYERIEGATENGSLDVSGFKISQDDTADIVLRRQ